MEKIAFGKLKKFEAIINLENFTRDAWCDIDYALNNNEDCIELINAELSPEIEEYVKYLKYIKESINKMFIIPKNNFD